LTYKPTEEEESKAQQNQADQNAIYFEAIVEKVQETVERQAEYGEDEDEDEDEEDAEHEG